MIICFLVIIYLLLIGGKLALELGCKKGVHHE